ALPSCAGDLLDDVIELQPVGPIGGGAGHHHQPVGRLGEAQLRSKVGVQLVQCQADRLGFDRMLRPKSLFGRQRSLCIEFRSVGEPYLDGLTTSTAEDRKSTRLNSSHVKISYAVFCLKKKKR